MDLEKLPKALKNKNIFCSWKYEQQENGRLTKPPYNPITGMNFDSDIYLFNCQIGNVLTMFRHRGLFPIRQ